MLLESGTRLGNYEVIAPLGRGGMGEVYRARDSRLQRDVALKVLPALFESDADRLARFEREAQLLAALNHPNIAIIHGIEDTGGIRGLILELVEGPTLEDRLQQGPLSIDDALQIGRQLISALETAHAHGIVHRDLKPSNIKVRPDGTVKVLDFGLAKALEPAPAAGSMTESPTITSPAMTAQGIILGTAAYMSPEQARGQAVDRRADIWAFGCVFYEMLTGARPFPGRDVAETLAFVLTKEPDWQALPAGTPQPIRRLLRRTLEKDARRRLADIADVRLELDDAAEEDPATPAATKPATPVRSRLAWVVAGISALLALAAGVWALRPAPVPPEMRLDITTPPTTDPASVAISPDGRKLVFAATVDGQSRLWIRSLDSTIARPLTGTENARLPFWSADNRSVGFSADAQVKRLDLDDGTLHRVAPAPVFLGGSWNQAGDILFAPDANSPVMRVAASGGEPRPATRLAPGEIGHNSPQFLPDGRRFLYFVAGTSEVRGIYVGELGSDSARRLLKAEYAVYLSSGYLLFVRDGSAFAQRVDPDSFIPSGEPLPIAERVAVRSFATASTAAVSTSHAGTIVYRSGEPLAPEFQIAWFDRAGKEVQKLGDRVRVALNPALSPDGQRLAVFRGDRDFDIWMVDTRTGLFSRFTFDPGVDFTAIWSPDGSRLIISSNRTGNYDLYEKSATGAGSEQVLLATPQNKTATDWSADGKFVLYRSYDPRDAFDIFALSLSDRKSFPVVQTAADERNAQFSPDGRWVAYQSNESGRFEIWVQPFSTPGNPRSGKWQVSTSGGAHPRWNRSGRELFYISGAGQLMSVPLRVTSDASAIAFDPPRALFSLASLNFATEGTILPPYAVSSDGERFLVPTTSLPDTSSPITVVLNWTGR